MPAIKQAIKEKAIPAAPDRFKFKAVPQLTDADMRALMHARNDYFNKRKIEILDLLEREFGGVEKVDESKKSDSTYFYLKNGRKVRLSDHEDLYNWNNKSDIRFADSDDEVLLKLRR